MRQPPPAIRRRRKACSHSSTTNSAASPLGRCLPLPPAVEINLAQFPAAPWLLEHDLSYDTDLHQDLNNDGVSLFIAYALDLNPRQNLRGSLPVPVLEGDSLSLSFPAARPDLTYTVQTSTDLKTWTTEGVTTSDLDPDGRRTATVPHDIPQRFLLLVVE